MDKLVVYVGINVQQFQPQIVNPGILLKSTHEPFCQPLRGEFCWSVGSKENPMKKKVESKDSYSKPPTNSASWWLMEPSLTRLYEIVYPMSFK